MRLLRRIGVKGGLTIGKCVSSETLPCLIFLRVCIGSFKVEIRLRNILMLIVLLAISKNDSIVSYIRLVLLSSSILAPPKSAVFSL